MSRTLVLARARVVALLLAVALLAVVAFSAFASHPTKVGAAQTGVVSIEVKITGKKQGVFKGDSTLKGHEDQIVVSAFAFEIISPRDAATGQPSGHRQFKPVMITKNLDAASPQVLIAASTNEVLSSVVINFFRTNREGMLTNFYRVTLTDATISDVRQYSSGDTVKEDVSFFFRKIQQQHLVPPQTTYQDDFAIAI